MRPIIFAAAACLLAAPAFAAELRPDQKQAVERMLADMEPSMREVFRPQIEQSVAMLDEAAIKALMAEMGAPPEWAEEEEASVLSPEDAAYNRAQIEPAARKAWAAQKEFDAFVVEELAARCPDREQYAVVDGPARYELHALSPYWNRASQNVEGDIAAYLSAFAPQDGRYDFDFSKLRESFDRNFVSTAITQACAAWAKEAAAFKQQAAALVGAGKHDAAFEFERSANAKAAPIEEKLQKDLESASPAGGLIMIEALQNGRRVR